MATPYRRLPEAVTKIVHVLAGFLTGLATLVHPLLATFIFLSFTVYEFSEWLHDLLYYRRARLVDWPDSEFAEFAFGVALFVVLWWLGLLR